MTRTRLSRLTLTLVLACTMGLSAAVPAAGTPRAGDRPPSPLSAVWEAVSSFWNGLLGQRPRSSGNHGPVSWTAADESDGHPEMDPNGLTGSADPPAAEGDGHPHMDPDG